MANAFEVDREGTAGGVEELLRELGLEAWPGVLYPSHCKSQEPQSIFATNDSRRMNGQVKYKHTFLPVLVHLSQAGFFSSHLTRRTKTPFLDKHMGKAS